MNSCLRTRVCNGFTLIELLITLSILAVLLGIGMPSLVSFINNNQMTSQANDLVYSVHMARSEAIKRRARIHRPFDDHLIEPKKPQFAPRLLKLWCPVPESNQGHEDFQSTALPTELTGHRKLIFVISREARIKASEPLFVKGYSLGGTYPSA